MLARPDGPLLSGDLCELSFRGRSGARNPPYPNPLPQGERGSEGGPSGLCSGCRSGWGRGGAAPTEKKSEGGWVGQSRAACSSGMGVWGAQLPLATRDRPWSLPHPDSLPPGERGSERAAVPRRQSDAPRPARDSLRDRLEVVTDNLAVVPEPHGSSGLAHSSPDQGGKQRRLRRGPRPRPPRRRRRQRDRSRRHWRCQRDRHRRDRRRPRHGACRRRRGPCHGACRRRWRPGPWGNHPHAPKSAGASPRFLMQQAPEIRPPASPAV